MTHVIIRDYIIFTNLAAKKHINNFSDILQIIKMHAVLRIK